MDAETVIHIGREAILLTLLLSGPPVLAALLIGLVVSLFQAATQVQESTLTVVPKIVAVYVVLVGTGLWALNQLVTFSTQLLEGIGGIGR